MPKALDQQTTVRKQPPGHSPNTGSASVLAGLHDHAEEGGSGSLHSQVQGDEPEKTHTVPGLLEGASKKGASSPLPPPTCSITGPLGQNTAAPPAPSLRRKPSAPLCPSPLTTGKPSFNKEIQKERRAGT